MARSSSIFRTTRSTAAAQGLAYALGYTLGRDSDLGHCAVFSFGRAVCSKLAPELDGPLDRVNAIIRPLRHKALDHVYPTREEGRDAYDLAAHLVPALAGVAAGAVNQDLSDDVRRRSVHRGVNEERTYGRHQVPENRAAKGRAHDGAEDERGDRHWNAQHHRDAAKKAGQPSHPVLELRWLGTNEFRPTPTARRPIGESTRRRLGVEAALKRWWWTWSPCRHAAGRPVPEG
jgi:hypothetical protein